MIELSKEEIGKLREAARLLIAHVEAEYSHSSLSVRARVYSLLARRLAETTVARLVEEEGLIPMDSEEALSRSVKDVIRLAFEEELGVILPDED